MAGLSIEEVRRLQKSFEQEYFFKEPFADHINMCGISKVGIKDKNAPADQKDDLCISVGLRMSLPEGILLPSEYRGIKVFTDVVGVIRAL